MPSLDRALYAFRRRVARPILHGLRRPVLLRRMQVRHEARVLGHRLQTDPGVFHPVYFSSSEVLAEHLLRRPLRGVRALDMGTGSGLIAIALAAAGARVSACDINPRAVALCRENAARNGLSIDVHESDLFAALSLAKGEGHAFDLIDFNVPFYPTTPTTHYEHAFRAGESLGTVRRFAAGAAEHLAPEGRVVIVYSEDCDRPTLLRAFTDTGFSVEEERVERRLLEDFYLTTFRLDSPIAAT